MTRRAFAAADALLRYLLDRHEAGGGESRPVAAIDQHGFGSVAERDAFDAELAGLEDAGAVRLIRKGPKRDKLVTGVRLTDPARVYAHLGRTPSDDQVDALLAGLRARFDFDEAALGLVDDVASAWRRGVGRAGIPRGDAGVLAHVLDLARAIGARLDSGAGELDYRTFSRAAVGDSKALERNVRQVAWALARLYPGLAIVGAEADELMAGLGLAKLPQPVLIGGALATPDGLFPPLPFVGIPPEAIPSLTLVRRPSYVLSVENYVSFVRHAREVGALDGGLTIYSGGFPSRPALDAIVGLSAAAQVPVFHWGDMDAGGVRIFQYLEQALAARGLALRPHLMGAELLHRFGRATAEGVPNRLGGFSGSVVDDLATALQETGLTHEQEEFDPIPPDRIGSEQAGVA